MSASCGVYQEAAESVSKLARAASVTTSTAAVGFAQVFKKPLFDFPRYGKALRTTISGLFQADNAMRSSMSRFLVITERLKRLGFYDDAGAMWRHGYKLLDTIPADVIISTEVKQWTPEILVRKARESIQMTLNNPELVGPTLVKYDKRYLDPKRIDYDEIKEALDALTPLGLEALQSLAGEMSTIRTLAIAGKRAQLMVSERMLAKLAAYSGRSYTIKTEEHLGKLLNKSLGPTVSSYIPHFAYDALTDDAMAPYLWRLTNQNEDLTYLAKEISQVIGAIPDSAALKKLGMRPVDWLAAELSERMFDGDEPASALMATASRLLRHRGRSVSLANQGDTIVKDISEEVYVKFYKRRVNSKLSSENVLNPFSRIEDYVVPVLRKAFLEPAVARVRMAGVGLDGVDQAASVRLNNWLNSLIGGKSSTGIDYLLRKTPGIGGLSRRAGAKVSQIIYNKLLLFNFSTAALNLTQPMQYGLGKHGGIATAAAFRLWTDTERFGHVISALDNAMLSESSLGAVLGGRSHNTAIAAFEFHLGGSENKARALLGDLMVDMRMAASPKEFRSLVLRGGVDKILALGQFMSMSEMVVRKYTTIAGAFKSALDQVLEQFPEAKIISKGFGDPKVALPDGRVIDIFDELASAAPKDGKYMAIFENTEMSGLIDWNRVMEDAIMQNADVNFVLSSANYSELERTIRRIPMLGQAAAAFSNYTLSVANRLGNDMTNLIYYSMQKLGNKTKVPVTAADAIKSAKRLRRYAVGTLLVGGPFAFDATIELGLKIAHALNPDVPDDIDDPRVRGVLTQLERLSIGGAIGVDYSSRVGFDFKDFGSILTGGRFVDNPMMDWISDIYGSAYADTASDRAKAKYNVLGKYARFFDPNQEFGDNPFGKSNPLVPMFLYNWAQMATDFADVADGKGLTNELGYMSELNPGTAEIAKRGFLGRTIMMREQMRRLAEERPEMSDKISTLRRQFVDAYQRKDFPAMRDINTDMAKVDPIDNLTDSQLHPNLMIDRRSLERWRMRHTEPHEIRQLMNMHRGVLRNDSARAIKHLESKGFIVKGKIDTDGIQNRGDSTDMLMLRILDLAFNRAAN